MNTNKIAYLIPVYNHDKYIEELLNSIKEDIYSIKSDIKKELIIIDDGSTDNCNEIIKRWRYNNSELNIKYNSRENKGLTNTLNELILSTDAEYLRLCASDDIIVPGSSSILLNNLKNGVNLFAVCGDAIIIDSKGDELFESSIQYHGGSIEKLMNQDLMANELILNWCIAGPSSLIKKSIYTDLKYKDNEEIDDFYLYLTLLEKNALKIVSDKVCKYRVHSTNTSKTNNNERRIKNLGSFLNIILDFKHIYYKYPSLSALECITRTKISFLKKNYFLAFRFFIHYKYKMFIINGDSKQ